MSGLDGGPTASGAWEGATFLSDLLPVRIRRRRDVGFMDNSLRVRI